jgi:hypothetical protein
LISGPIMCESGGWPRSLRPFINTSEGAPVPSHLGPEYHDLHRRELNQISAILDASPAIRKALVRS